MTAYEALQKKYELEASLNNMGERLEELEEAIPELRYQHREAKEAASAAGGGFRRFLNRLSGKGEENPEERERHARRAEEALKGAQRELTAMQERFASARAESEALGEKQALLDQLTEGEKAHFLRMEASLSAEHALHYLRKCRKELEQAQYYARNPMMAVGEGRQEDVHKANAGALADRCREKLEQIHSCGFPFDIHPYLQNPMGYIVTARRFGDQDRMNSAQQGIRDTETALRELLLQLTE